MSTQTSGRKRRIILAVAALVAVSGAGIGVHLAFRAKRTYAVLRDWAAQVRYVKNSGESIDSQPAATTFSAGYLEAVFGSDPALLKQLKNLIAQGLAENPSLNLGEVTAMIVTYQEAKDGTPENVAMHVLGYFSVGERTPGFHRGGYFSQQLDRNLWDTGNTVLGMLGRDAVVFADPKTDQMYTEIRTGIVGGGGNITPLVKAISDMPMYFTAVLPSPGRILPPQLRHHIQAVIIKGHLDPEQGGYEVTLLTKEQRSAAYTMEVVSDLRMAAELALKGRFDGVAHKMPWGGTEINTWWAYAMAQTVNQSVIERQQNIISIKTDFQRVMVNATLKTIERMGRDMTQMRMVMSEKLDPRVANAALKSDKPGHYWDTAHQWGPDWPVPAPDTNQVSSTGVGTNKTSR